MNLLTDIYVFPISDTKLLGHNKCYKFRDDFVLFTCGQYNKKR